MFISMSIQQRCTSQRAPAERAAGRVPDPMGVAIVSDTCHYLPRELLAKHNVREVSLYVHWQDQTQRESELTNYDDYYARLRTASDLPTTSQPSIGDFLEV